MLGLLLHRKLQFTRHSGGRELAGRNERIPKTRNMTGGVIFGGEGAVSQSLEQALLELLVK